MVAVAAASCGLAGFVPPLWAARQRRGDAPFRRRMHAWAGGLFGLMVVGVFLVSVGSEDASGEPTGLVSDLGGTALLVTRDPALARSLGIGRPDPPRTVDDGGLLDLNAIPADQLGALAGLTAEEASRVADARHQAGPFVSIDEVAVWSELPDSTVTRLRERAIFF